MQHPKPRDPDRSNMEALKLAFETVIEESMRELRLAIG
jgi:hypothetical protein